MKKERLTYLIDQLVQKKISAEEQGELRDLLNNHDATLLAERGVVIWLNEKLGVSQQESEETLQRQVNDILSIDKVDTNFIPEENKFTGTAHRVHFLRRWGWAAAILLVLGTGAYLYTSTKHNEKPVITQRQNTGDILPGTNKAILTLADGTAIVLDNAANGPIAQQNGVKLIKTAEGRLEYEVVRGKNDPLAYNTIRTPRGGQYQLRLPDGTEVWLNAASAITYPTVFSEKERIVKVSGEVFFDVAKDKSRPFRVQAGTVEIEALGTEFNVNAYDDELTLNTTLLEGSVRIASYREGNTMMATKQQLKPGQQAQVGRQGAIAITEDIDTEAVIAWKNGYFSFDNTELTALMRQISRWYDVEIEYAGKIPTRKFGGEISRNSNILQALKILEESKVYFRIEGKKIIVLP